MGSSPSIAVVIPAYNAASTIENSLRSVLAQSDPVSEIIVVDDGSSDGTAKVAESFDPSVRVIRQENQGSAVARQIGTERASSDYIAYLDADDWWPRERISVCREVLGAHDVYFLMTDFVRARPGEPPKNHLPRNTTFFPWFIDIAKHAAGPSAIPELSCLESHLALECMLRGFPCFPSACIIRRASIFDVGGWDSRFRRCQDFDIALRLTRNYPFHFLNEPLAVVGINAGNEDASLYVAGQTAGDILVLKTRLKEETLGRDYSDRVARSIGAKYYGLGNAHRVIGNKLEASRAFANAFAWPGCRSKAAIRFVATWLTHR